MKKGLYCHQLLLNLLTKEQIDTTIRRILGKGWPLVQLALLSMDIAERRCKGTCCFQHVFFRAFATVFQHRTIITMHNLQGFLQNVDLIEKVDQWTRAERYCKGIFVTFGGKRHKRPQKEWMECQGFRPHRGNLECGIKFSSPRKNRELDTLGHEQVIISFPLQK